MPSCGKTDILKEWFEATTFHGVPDWHRQSCWGCGFFTWSIALAIASIMVILQLYDQISSFIQNDPWTTSESVQQTDSLPFPNVSLCNFNLVNISKVHDLGLYNSTLYAPMLTGNMSSQFQISNTTQLTVQTIVECLFGVVASMTIPASSVSLSTTEYMVGAEALSLLASAQPRYADILNLLSDVMHKCQSICMWSSRTIFNCCSALIFHQQFGYCYQIVTPQSAQIASGPRFGLRIMHLPHLELYSPFIAYVALDAGIALDVSYTVGTYRLGLDLIAVAPGTHAYISMSAQQAITQYDQTTLRSPGCQPPQNPQYKLINTSAWPSSSYDQSTCQLDCLAQSVYNVSKCAALGVTLKQNITTQNGACTPLEWLPYAMAYENSSFLQTFVSCFSSSCPEECEKNSILVSTSYAQYPAPAKFASIESYFSLSPSMIDEFILVDVFFDEMVWHVTNRYVSTTIATLFANIGGQMGLWLGASVISVFQLLFFIVCELLKRRRGCCKGRATLPEGAEQNAAPEFHNGIQIPEYY